jgi:hypothetical protein
MAPQNSCPIQRVQTYLALRSYMSSQASGLPMTNERQAGRMLTAAANPAGGLYLQANFMKPVAVFLLELSRTAIPSREDLRTAAMQALSPSGSKSSSGTATLSAEDSADKRVATLKEANDIEWERFENEKKRFENEKELHDIKIAETRLKNVTAILSHPPASLSEAQLKRMREQEVFLTGVVTGVDMNEDLEPATSAQRRKVGE